MFVLFVVRLWWFHGSSESMVGSQKLSASVAINMFRHKQDFQLRKQTWCKSLVFLAAPHSCGALLKALLKAPGKWKWCAPTTSHLPLYSAYMQASKPASQPASKQASKPAARKQASKAKQSKASKEQLHPIWLGYAFNACPAPPSSALSLLSCSLFLLFS